MMVRDHAAARPRGHILLLLVTLLAGALIGSALLLNRVSVEVEDRADEEVRTQALWLARSALDAGVTGTRTVQTAAGPAVVRAASGSVEVELAGAHARVSSSEPRERFVPAGR